MHLQTVTINLYNNNYKPASAMQTAEGSLKLNTVQTFRSCWPRNIWNKFQVDDLLEAKLLTAENIFITNPDDVIQ